MPLLWQFAPGVTISVDGFGVGFNAAEIFLDYNFSTNKSFSEIR